VSDSDDTDIERVPAGYKHTLLIVAVLKSALATCEMTAREQLEILETLNGLVDSYLTSAALAALEPAEPATIEVVRQAWRLDGNTDKPSFAVLTSPEVFDNLIAANPSIARAIELCARRHRPSAPPAAASPDVPPQAPSPTAASAPPYFDPRLEPNAEPQIAQGVDFDLF
jgi:hypothetical protein